MAVQTLNIPEIKICGRRLDGYVVTDVSLSKELLKPNELRFSMRKNTMLKTSGDISFEIADKLLGAEVECKTSTCGLDKDGKCEKKENLSFKGLVFNVNSRRGSMNGCVVIDCVAYSPDYLLIDNPHCYSYEDMTLSDIINESIESYSGTINKTTDTRMSDAIHYTVQYNETTYGFLSRLAQRYGEFFYFEDGKMVFGKMKRNPKISLYPDIDILSYHYELNLDHTNFSHAQHNYLGYIDSQEDAYDYSSNKMHKMTDYVYNHSKSLFKKQTLQNYLSAVQEENDVEQIEESVRNQASSAKSQMMICRAVTNRCDIKLGSVVVIQENADSNDEVELKNHEELMVCSIKYNWDIDGNMEGVFTAIPSKSEYPPYNACDLFPVSDSQRAVVVDNKDPEEIGRIRVQFQWQKLQDDNLMTPWIRMTQPHGGDNKGFYCIPEIGEEVMVCFENGNAEKPYVIGTLYHGRQHPGDGWYNDGNDIKAFRTRNGHTVEVHDAGDGGYIRIYDNEKENYVLTYSTDEKLIKLESKGNIELYADNDIIMEAGNNMNIKVGNDMTVNVGNDKTVEIGNDEKVSIANDNTIDIGNSQELTVNNNQIITVENNQEVSVNNNKDEYVTESYQVEAKNMRTDVDEKYQLITNDTEIKSDKATKIDGGNKMDIKADNVKIN